MNVRPAPIANKCSTSKTSKSQMVSRTNTAKNDPATKATDLKQHEVAVQLNKVSACEVNFKLKTYLLRQFLVCNKKIAHKNTLETPDEKSSNSSVGVCFKVPSLHEVLVTKLIKNEPPSR